MYAYIYRKRANSSWQYDRNLREYDESEITGALIRVFSLIRVRTKTKKKPFFSVYFRTRKKQELN